MGGLSAHLYTAKTGLLQLDVSAKKAGRQEYSLPVVAPGDSLTFRFLRARRFGHQSMAKLADFARAPMTRKARRKIRLGLDCVLSAGHTIRTAHPNRGGFSFMLSNIPWGYARSFVMAWNQKERWHWQLADLHPGDEITLRVVETDWCSEPDPSQD